MFCFIKKSVLIILVLTVAMYLIGCGMSNKEQKTTLKSPSGEYSVSGDNLSLDTVIDTSSNRIDEIVVSPYKISADAAKKAFLKKAEKLDYNDIEDEGEYYVDEEGNTVSIINSTGVTYISKFYEYLINSFRLDPRDEKYNGDKFSKTREFKFMSRDEALNVLKDKLKKLGVELGDIEYTCYSLDYKTLEKEEYAENMYGAEDTSVYKNRWTSKDNCYFFAIRQKCNNIIEYHKAAGMMRNYEDCNSSITAVVSKRGVESLEMQCVLTFKNTGKKIKIMEPQQVLDKISAKYGKVLGEQKYTITSFNLCYMTDIMNDYTVTPIYQCHMIEENDEGERVEQLLINAVTGEELE